MEAAFLCPTRYRAVDSWLASGWWSRVSVIRVEIEKANSYHFPHWDCEFPGNLHQTQRRKDLSDQTKNKVLYDNVKALYGI
jgi:hypothetical protein